MIHVIQRGANRTKEIVQALHNYSRGDDEKVVATNKGTGPAPTVVKEPAKPLELPKAATNYPRRFLAVCIHNYLYANPVSARGCAGRNSRYHRSTSAASARS